jgi:type II secretory pathway pseudopilin PulG
MKRIHRDEKGFSILELVIVILLTGIITAAVTTTFFQVFNMNTRTANHMIAVSQVQQAGKIVSEDMLEAQPQSDMIDDSPEEGEFLILGWVAQNSTEYKVIYTLEDMPNGEFKVLWRYYYIKEDSESEFELDSTAKVAEYINPVDTSCECSCDDCDCGDLDDLVLTFTVTATVGDESETREYIVQPRPGS